MEQAVLKLKNSPKLHICDPYWAKIKISIQNFYILSLRRSWCLETRVFSVLLQKTASIQQCSTCESLTLILYPTVLNRWPPTAKIQVYSWIFCPSPSCKNNFSLFPINLTAECMNDFSLCGSIWPPSLILLKRPLAPIDSNALKEIPV